MAIFGIGAPDVVPVATDLLSTTQQKQTVQRVHQDLDEREANLAPEMLAKERIRLGANAPDYSQGFAAPNASHLTAGIPIQV